MQNRMQTHGYVANLAMYCGCVREGVAVSRRNPRLPIDSISHPTLPQHLVKILAM